MITHNAYKLKQFYKTSNFKCPALFEFNTDGIYVIKVAMEQLFTKQVKFKRHKQFAAPERGSIPVFR